MQGGRGPFFNFGDPNGNTSGFGGFGGQRSLLSNFFGGRDPFDDPFFTRPFGGLLESSPFGPGGGLLESSPFGPGGGLLGSSPFGPSGGLFGSSPFGPSGGLFESSPFGPSGGPFMNSHMPGFLEQQPHVSSQPPRSRGPVIEELDSDDEKEEKEIAEEKKHNPRKHGRSSTEPYVEYPDDEAEERKGKQMQYRNFRRTNNEQPQPQPQVRSFSFQSSSVSYGGANGTYYTKSKTMRTGSDGLTFEESKEADSASGQATHRVSRGIQNKGHSVLRKLKSDGGVDTMQALHNLNEDELNGFEESWKQKARGQLPGLSGGFNLQGDTGSVSSAQDGLNRGGWALPSTETSHHSGNLGAGVGHIAGPSHLTHSEMIQTDRGDMVMGSSAVKSRNKSASNMGKAKRR